MKVTQEKLPNSQIGLEIEVPSQTTKGVYERVVQNLARSTSIPGFRKGKVPRQVLLQRIGNQRIKATALEEIIQTSLKEALDTESIKALGNYQLTSDFEQLISSYKPGEPLTFKASVDVNPEVELGDYQNLTVTAEEIKYSPVQVEDSLEESRQKLADLVPVEDRPAEMGDVAIVDFSGRLNVEGEDNPEIEGGSATNFEVEIAPGKLIPGMVEGIVGMRPEETKEVEVSFPDDYGVEELAGKPAVFTITLKELKTKQLPELDDDFAQEASGEEFETLDALRESLEQQFKTKAEAATNNNIDEAIVDQLAAISQVEPPETMVQEEVTNMLTQTLVQMQQMGIDVKRIFTPDTVPQMRDRTRPDAVDKLRKDLIVEAIAERESLQPNDEEIEAKIAEISAELSGQDIDQNKLRQMVESDLTKEKTLAWLRERATVELVPEGSLSTSEATDEEVGEQAEAQTESDQTDS